MKIFLDSDVLIDFLNSRIPFVDDITALLAFFHNSDIKTYTSVIVIANIHYVVGRELGKQIANQCTEKLMTNVEILSVHKSTIAAAQNSKFHDFEDAIQFNCALENKMDFIVTRNVKDYSKSSIPVHKPKELLQLLMK